MLNLEWVSEAKERHLSSWKPYFQIGTTERFCAALTNHFQIIKEYISQTRIQFVLLTKTKGRMHVRMSTILSSSTNGVKSANIYPAKYILARVNYNKLKTKKICPWKTFQKVCPINIEYMWRIVPWDLRIKISQHCIDPTKNIPKNESCNLMNVYQPTSVKKYQKQIPSNIEHICWMYISQKQFQKERPANIEYIWWMFPWAGPSFPVSLTMATSANGHNLTVTFRPILIFYIWNLS